MDADSLLRNVGAAVTIFRLFSGVIMRKLALALFKDSGNIRDFVRKNIQLKDAASRRSAVKIAVIDDNPFKPQTNLANYGYKITPIGDIKSVSEVADYNIVLCDLMGVGLHFDQKNQGASIIAQIKQSYPSKIIIAYTGAAMGSQVARSAGDIADQIIRKDVDNDEWVATLDRQALDSVDPYVLWTKTRARLVDLGAETKAILILEDAYVRSVLSRDSGFHNLKNAMSEINLAGDARSIVNGLISSIIFTVIFGT